MAIAYLQEFTIQDGDTSTTNYDAVSAALGLEGVPDGLLIHTAGFDHDGGVFRIFDVWASREQGEKFIKERLNPIIEPMAAKAAQDTDSNFIPPGPRDLVRAARLAARLGGLAKQWLSRTLLITIELDEALVADAEMVRDLVEHDAADLLAQPVAVGAVEADERIAVDRDLVGRDARVLAASLRQRHALVEPEERRAGCRLVLDDNRDVRHRLEQLGRQAVDRILDSLLEIDVVHETHRACSVTAPTPPPVESRVPPSCSTSLDSSPPTTGSSATVCPSGCRTA